MSANSKKMQLQLQPVLSLCCTLQQRLQGRSSLRQQQLLLQQQSHQTDS
jgi:hypothetical protein